MNEHEEKKTNDADAINDGAVALQDEPVADVGVSDEEHEESRPHADHETPEESSGSAKQKADAVLQDHPEVTEPESNEFTKRQLDHYTAWRDQINAITSEIDLDKEEKKQIGSRITLNEKKLRSIIDKGPEGMFFRPLLDIAEGAENEQESVTQTTDSEIWRQTPIDHLELTEKFVAKIGDHL